MISNQAERCETCRGPKQQVQQKGQWIDVCVMTPGIVLDICRRKSQESAPVPQSFDRVVVLLPAYGAVIAAYAGPVNDDDGSETKHHRQDPALEIETHFPSGPIEWGTRSRNRRSPRYFGAMVGLIQPFFMMPCDGRKLR